MDRNNELHLYIESRVQRDFISPNDLKCFNSTMATREGDKGLGITSSTDYILCDEDENIIKILKKFTDQSKIEFKVHDLAHKEEKRKAKSKGIKDTPLIFFNNRMIPQVPSEEESLLKLLGVQEKEIMILISREPILTVIIEGDIICNNCGSRNLKVYSDGSGFCAECGKAYMEIKTSG